jgi:RNA polymerase sigma-70 factor (ECF subfamily)
VARDAEACTATTTNRPRLTAAEVNELYREHSEELRCFLLGVLSNLDAANEVLQVTFVKTAEQGHTAQTESIKGWLFRVAFNEAMTQKRRQSVWMRAAQKLAEVPPRYADAPDELISLGEQRAEVRLAVAGLSLEHRQIIQARIYEDKTLAAIATELKLPLGTVYARLQQALRALRERLA